MSSHITNGAGAQANRGQRGCVIAVAVGFAIAIAVGYWLYADAAAKQEERNREALRRQQQAAGAKAALAEVVSKHKAIDDWDKALSKGKHFRIAPILSIELERLWVADRPILFIGHVADIASTPDASFYNVTIDRGDITPSGIFATDLRLSLRAPKGIVDSALGLHPEIISGRVLQDSVAIVANISRITASERHASDGQRITALTGHGDLLGMVHVGDPLLLKEAD